MKKSHARATRIVLILSLLSALPSPDLVSATKIMLLGDSITELNWEGGYRSLLYKKLCDAGYVFEYVGTNTSNHDDTNLGFDFPQAYWYHEGHNSATIDVSSVWQWSAKLRSKLTANPPDVLLVLLGVNDIANGTRPPAVILSTMSALLDSIWAFNASIKVVLSNLTPMFPGELYDSTTAKNIRQYNALLPAMVATKVQAGSYCVLVDNYSALTDTSDVEDGVHPSVTGYPKMVDVWYPAVTEILSHALPIQLAGFKVNMISADAVTLQWTTVSEVNNYAFYVQRSADAKTFTTLPGSFQAGHGTTIEHHDYSYTDATAAGKQYYYRLQQIDRDGTTTYSEAKEAEGTTDVKEQEPAEFALQQNYPNPFNPSTQIRFAVPAASNVQINIYNIEGGFVRQLFDGRLERGYHNVEWDGKNHSGVKVSSGTYFCQLNAGGKNMLRKMLLVR